MTAEDEQRLAMLTARGKKLYDDFQTTGRGSFLQPLRVKHDRRWYDTSGIPGGDYETQMVSATVTTQAMYELAKRTMVNDIATFKVAVARADADGDGEIYYVPGQGFTTVTAADQAAADRATMVAAGIFFATDTLPMMLSPVGMRGTVRAEVVVDLGAGPVPVAYADAQGWEHDVPNPNGKNGGLPHQRLIDQIEADIIARGLRPQREFKVDTSGGKKQTRFVDIVAIDPATGQVVEVHQVGKGRKSNTRIPIARERDALRDMRNRPEVRDAKRIFHPYN